MPHKNPIWLSQYSIDKGEHISSKTEFKKGHKPHNTGSKAKQVIQKCEICGKEFRHYLSQKKARFCSQECKNLWQKGPNNPLWKGGFKNSEAYKSRIENKTEYHKWRIKVLARDNFICQKCNKENSFDAHHIKSWKEHPELRFEIDNGQTLCKDCHNKTKGNNFHLSP